MSGVSPKYFVSSFKVKSSDATFSVHRTDIHEFSNELGGILKEAKDKGFSVNDLNCWRLFLKLSDQPNDSDIRHGKMPLNDAIGIFQNLTGEKIAFDLGKYGGVNMPLVNKQPSEEPSEEQPSEESSEEQPSEEQPSEELSEEPSEEQPSEEPSEEQPSEEQPSEEQSIELELNISSDKPPEFSQKKKNRRRRQKN